MKTTPEHHVSGRLEILGRLIDSSPAVLCLWRIEPNCWPVEALSANVQGLLGYSVEDFTSGRVSWPGITHPEDVPRLEREVGHILAEGRDTWSQQYRLITKGGRTILVEDWNRLVRDADGKATHIQALVMDITERKRAAEALRQSEERYRTLFESSRDAIMTLFPPDWKFTSANPSTVKMFGAHDEKEFVSMPPWEVSPERQPDGLLSIEKAKRIIETAMETGTHFFEWTHRRMGGDSFPATVLLTRVTLAGEVGLQATVRDITDLKRMDEALRSHREHLEELVQVRTQELEAEIAVRKQVEEALNQANEQLEGRVRERTTSLQSLAAKLTQTAHKERRRIADLLHEDLQQRLVAIKYKVCDLEESLESASALRTANRTIHELTEAIELTRNLTTRLAPPALYQLGLHPALETLMKEMAVHFSLSVKITGLRTFRVPADEIAHFAFDAVRELLLNVAKHAGVKSAEIRIRPAGKKRIAVEVRDKGKGIVVSKDPNGHYGLFSIRERAEAMGIGFAVSSRPGKGTSVSLILPIL